MRPSGIYFDHPDLSRKNTQMLTKQQLVKREMLYQTGGADKSFLKEDSQTRTRWVKMDGWMDGCAKGTIQCRAIIKQLYSYLVSEIHVSHKASTLRRPL